MCLHGDCLIDHERDAREEAWEAALDAFIWGAEPDEEGWE